MAEEKKSIATAYVQILPTTLGIQKNIEKELQGTSETIEKTLGSAFTSATKDLSRGLNDAAADFEKSLSSAMSNLSNMKVDMSKVTDSFKIDTKSSDFTGVTKAADDAFDSILKSAGDSGKSTGQEFSAEFKQQAQDMWHDVFRNQILTGDLDGGYKSQWASLLGNYAFTGSLDEDGMKQLQKEERLLSQFKNKLYDDSSKSGIKSGNAFAGQFSQAAKTLLARFSLAALLVKGTSDAARFVVNTIKDSLEDYATTERLQAGVLNFYKTNATNVMNSALEAYRTAGTSANDYLQNSAIFSAALLRSTGQDTARAAELVDIAMTDMADNVNTIGNNLDDIQVAYRGFSRNTYLMLDNLRIGYGGTRKEMKRLLADAEEIMAAQGKTVSYTIDNFGDMVEAIHVVQENLGFSGMTELKADTTLAGSADALKAAWENWKAGIPSDRSDFAELTDALTDSLKTAADNWVPALKQAVKQVFSRSTSTPADMLSRTIDNMAEAQDKLEKKTNITALVSQYNALREELESGALSTREIVDKETELDGIRAQLVKVTGNAKIAEGDYNDSLDETVRLEGLLAEAEANRAKSDYLKYLTDGAEEYQAALSRVGMFEKELQAIDPLSGGISTTGWVDALRAELERAETLTDESDIEHYIENVEALYSAFNGKNIQLDNLDAAAEAMNQILKAAEGASDPLSAVGKSFEGWNSLSKWNGLSFTGTLNSLTGGIFGNMKSSLHDLWPEIFADWEGYNGAHGALPVWFSAEFDETDANEALIGWFSEVQGLAADNAAVISEYEQQALQAVIDGYVDVGTAARNLGWTVEEVNDKINTLQNNQAFSDAASSISTVFSKVASAATEGITKSFTDVFEGAQDVIESYADSGIEAIDSLYAETQKDMGGAKRIRGIIDDFYELAISGGAGADAVKNARKQLELLANSNSKNVIDIADSGLDKLDQMEEILSLADALDAAAISGEDFEHVLKDIQAQYDELGETDDEQLSKLLDYAEGRIDASKATASLVDIRKETLSSLKTGKKLRDAYVELNKEFEKAQDEGDETARALAEMALAELDAAAGAEELATGFPNLIAHTSQFGMTINDLGKYLHDNELDVEDWGNSIQSNIDNTINGYDKLDTSLHMSVNRMYKNYSDNVRRTQEWADNLERLMNIAYSSGDQNAVDWVKSLKDQGVQNAKQIAEIARSVNADDIVASFADLYARSVDTQLQLSFDDTVWNDTDLTDATAQAAMAAQTAFENISGWETAGENSLSRIADGVEAEQENFADRVAAVADDTADAVADKGASKWYEAGNTLMNALVDGVIGHPVMNILSKTGALDIFGNLPDLTEYVKAATTSGAIPNNYRDARSSTAVPEMSTEVNIVNDLDMDLSDLSDMVKMYMEEKLRSIWAQAKRVNSNYGTRYS